MVTTDKQSCRIIVSLLEAHGVRHAVVSPGSRNAPLLVALSRSGTISTTVVVDERSAAFVALGLATVSGRAVALVCTSGTALLNYAPAVAEAYYRRVPLIVISADRPMEWIDQDDSQTLRQYEALSHYVKRSYDIPARCDDDNARWYCNRIVNDALLLAVTGRTAPVHINVQLDAPLGRMADCTVRPERVIDCVQPRADLPVAESRRLGDSIASPCRVLIIGGFMPPDEKLNRALAKLSSKSNVTVMCENLTNLHGDDFIDSIDSTLSVMSEEERQVMRPDMVITFGGAIVSRMIKQYLRDCKPARHWHVGITENTIDCFQALTTRVEMSPAIFFTQLASALQPHDAPSDYSCRWDAIRRRARKSHAAYVDTVPWSDLKAFSMLFDRIPRGWNLHFSNGTSIRYAQLFPSGGLHRCDCNRGVSGIDGCTSTAIGASMGYNGTTLLVTGDMSAQYDVGALACMEMPPRFKMIVMCNGGGGIFRFIDSTSALPECERYFAASAEFPARQLADAYGLAFFEASDESELRREWGGFAAETARPAMLAIHTPPMESAEVLRGYFTRETNKTT
ncbi:MAG: 2-succinyl-5-enolpyruvyl-6-hydroxy-3-cyclohexene-1-carboxylic-acid synthase [Pseudoflavonifractor sp.]|nr:2-succinyl-5-enolpyruvyl-6-hydroxy-3-cyclohexene-1-carboxylic-acid synthase [Pseudoflavonifractor sp.]